MLCFNRIVVPTYGRFTNNCFKIPLSPSAWPATPAAVITDITIDNWTICKKAFILSCYTKLGVTGQQHRNPADPIPYRPHQAGPLYKSWRNSHYKSMYICQTRHKLRSQASTSQQFSYLKHPITNIVMTLKFTPPPPVSLLSRISSASITCVDTSHHPHTHQFWSTLSTQFINSSLSVNSVLCSIGNAKTKLHRTRQCVNMSKTSDLTLEQYMEQTCSIAETFNLDFESPTYPG